MELFIRRLHRTMECLHPTVRGVHFQLQTTGTNVSEVPEVTRNGNHPRILELLTETPAVNGGGNAYHCGVDVQRKGPD